MTTPATAPVVNTEIPSPFPQNGVSTPQEPVPQVQETMEQTVKIPLADLVKEEEPQAKSISFKSSASLSEHVSKPTVHVSPDPATTTNQFAGQSSKELRKHMINEELQPADEMAPEDFEMIAGFLIDAWDLGTVTLLRMYALDKTDQPYEMTGTKKTKLRKMLSMILIRFNKKFPLGVLFVLTLVLTHITPAMKAHAHRKEVQALNPKKRGPKKGSTQKSKEKPQEAVPKATKVSPDAPSAAPEADESPGVVNPEETRLPPKKRGAQAK